MLTFHVTWPLWLARYSYPALLGRFIVVITRRRAEVSYTYGNSKWQVKGTKDKADLDISELDWVTHGSQKRYDETC